MRPTPEVSVIMSVFNGMPYLELAAKSIAVQTYKDFDFIIVDDASTDSSWEYLTALARDDGRVHLLQNSVNRGYSRSLNAAIANCQSEFVARQDADDISLPERLERQLEFLKLHPEVGLVGTLAEFVDEHGHPLEVLQYAQLTENEDIQRQLPDSNCIRHGATMVRRQLLLDVGPFDPELEPAEDYDLWLRIAEVAEIANLPERLYLYREHEQSTSTGRRHVQVHNKAVSLERALNRRFPGLAPPELMALVGRDFLRAAILGCVTGHMKAASLDVEHALRITPSIVDSGDLIESEALACFSSQRSLDQPGLAQTLFDQLLPTTRHLLRVRRKVIGALHMQSVFESLDDLHAPGVGRHLLAGIAADPRWMLNRGVLAIGLRLLGLRMGAGRAGERPNV